MRTSRPGRPEPSDLLVAGQVVALALLVRPGRARWTLPAPARAAAAVAVLAGGALAGASGARLGPGLTPRVEPPEGAVLRTDGPYALVRHPLYAGLLAAATGVAVLRRRPEPLAALAALSVVLHLKAGAEERHLERRFGSAYRDYASVRPRLVPTAGAVAAALRSRASRSRR